MHRISMVNVWSIFKINFHLAVRNNCIIAIIYLLIVPILRGIANLDAIRSAECLEQAISIIGIFIIVPLAASEQSKAIQEAIYTKKVPEWIILLIRLIMSWLIVIIMISIFAGIMVLNNCTFPYKYYVAGTIISALALGSVGFLMSVLSNSVVVGYLVSIGYFLFNFLGYISSKSKLYLFSLETQSYTTKIWAALVSAILIIIALNYVKKRRY